MERIDQSREPIPWNVILGIAMMLAAAGTALFSDYPLARARALQKSSANGPARLQLRPTNPVGEIDGPPAELAFCWSGRPPQDAECELVVLSDGFRELFRCPAVNGSLIPESLSCKILPGHGYHWFVELGGAGRRSRSPVARFVVPGQTAADGTPVQSGSVDGLAARPR